MILIFTQTYIYIPLQLKSRKIYQHLANWMRYNKIDDGWNSTNALLSDVSTTVKA